MPSNSTLFMPIEIKPWVVNNAVKLKNARRQNLDYTSLATFDTPEPNMNSNEVPFQTGIYVQWELPKGLKHGLKTKTTTDQNAFKQADPSSIFAETQYPAIPDRWLVARLSGPVDKRVAMAWIIESTYKANDPNGANFPDADSPDEILLGRKIPLAQWPDANTNEPTNYLSNLSAVSNGNIAFTAFQLHNQNVLSFYDDMKDAEGNDIAADNNISYFVSGWYSTLSQDPISILNQAIQTQQAGTSLTFSDVLPSWYQQLSDEYLAQIDSVDDTNLLSYSDKVQALTNSNYSGFSVGVTWDINGNAPPSSQDTISPANIQVAIGNTSLDALTALLSHQPSAANSNPLIPPALLNAFKLGLLNKLDEIDSDEIIAHQGHQAGFGAYTGPTVWEIVAKESTGADAQAETPPSVLPPEIIASLNALSQSQADYDAQRRILQAQQWDLYSLWLKAGKAPYAYPNLPDTFIAAITDQLDTTATTSFFNVVKTQQQNVNDLYNALKQAYLKLESTLENLEPAQELKASNPSPFWHPVDPVILISGIKNPGSVGMSDKVLSRLNEQVLQAVDYTQSGQALSKDISAITLSANLQLTNLPAADSVTAVWNEFLLFDACLPVAGNTLTTTNTTARLPDHSVVLWTQPWQPLFLDWNINWFAIPFNDWHFDGERYVLDSVNQASPSQGIYGRTFLTPQASFAFKGRLVQLLQQHEELKTAYPKIDFDDLIKQIDAWDMLSQRLSGFHLQLVSRDSKMNRVPALDSEKDYQTVIANQTEGAPIVGSSEIDSTGSVSLFAPTRHGQFSLVDLTVIDQFGQFHETISAASGDPFISDDMTVNPAIAMPGSPSRLIQLAPRIVQSAAVQFDWIDGQSATPDTLTLHRDINPICGWLLPNYLEGSLQVYDSVGHTLGELRPGVDAVQWEPAILSLYTSLDALIKDFPQLGNILLQIQTQSLAVFQDYLTLIETAFTAKPLPSTRYLKYASAIIGRPLALVRSQWQLQLADHPYCDQSWITTPAQLNYLPSSATPTPYNQEFLGYSFPTRIGNPLLNQDGVIGYFRENDYSRFYSVYSDGTPFSNPDYMQLINGTELILKLNNATPTVTMLLVDPIGNVNAYTDILPVTSVSLPTRYIDAALQQMAVYFHIGPLLSLAHPAPASASDPTEPASVVLPKPALGGKWSWLESGGDAANLQEFAIVAADSKARFTNTSYELIDGILKLSGANNVTALAKPTAQRSTVAVPNYILNVSGVGNNCGLFALCLSIKTTILPTSQALTLSTELRDFVNNTQTIDLQEKTATTPKVISWLRNQLYQAVKTNAVYKEMYFTSFCICAVSYLNNQAMPEEMSTLTTPNKQRLAYLKQQWRQPTSTQLQDLLNTIITIRKPLEHEITKIAADSEKIIRGNPDAVKEQLEQLFPDFMTQALKPDSFIYYYKLWRSARVRVFNQTLSDLQRQSLDRNMHSIFQAAATHVANDVLPFLYAVLMELDFDAASNLINYELTQDQYKTIVTAAQALWVTATLRVTWNEEYEAYCRFLRDKETYLTFYELDCVAMLWNVRLSVRFADGKEFQSQASSNSNQSTVLLINLSKSHWQVVSNRPAPMEEKDQPSKSMVLLSELKEQLLQVLEASRHPATPLRDVHDRLQAINAATKSAMLTLKTTSSAKANGFFNDTSAPNLSAPPATQLTSPFTLR